MEVKTKMMTSIKDEPNTQKIQRILCIYLSKISINTGCVISTYLDFKKKLWRCFAYNIMPFCPRDL